MWDLMLDANKNQAVSKVSEKLGLSEMYIRQFLILQDRADFDQEKEIINVFREVLKEQGKLTLKTASA